MTFLVERQFCPKDANVDPPLIFDFQRDALPSNNPQVQNMLTQDATYAPLRVFLVFWLIRIHT